MVRFIFIISLLMSTGCSLLNEKPHVYDNFLLEGEDVDYIDHLVSLGRFYNKSPSIKLKKISTKSKKYLDSLYKSIVTNNELILPQRVSPKFYIVYSEIPFYFSLPSANFYFSTGLLTDYIKNESLLVSILSFQIIKSLKRIYDKKILPPVGFIRTNRILSLVRVSLKVKNDINKWAYMCMKRAGFDSSAYLMWLQIQNKQSLDFSVQYGNMQSISREELAFKNFVATRESSERVFEEAEKNSSSEFYYFLREVNLNRI